MGSPGSLHQRMRSDCPIATRSGSDIHGTGQPRVDSGLDEDADRSLGTSDGAGATGIDATAGKGGGAADGATGAGTMERKAGARTSMVGA